MRSRLPDITLQFAQWFGRSLRWWERNIIFTLERQRRRRQPIRVHIVDWPDTDSTEVLIAYINWLMTLNSGLDLAIVDTNLRAAHALQYRFTRRPIAYASERRPDRLRGCTFGILYAHDLSPRKSAELHRYVAGTIPLTGEGFVVIYHTCSGTRIPRFPVMYEREISISAYRDLHHRDLDPPPKEVIYFISHHSDLILPTSLIPHHSDLLPPFIPHHSDLKPPAATRQLPRPRGCPHPISQRRED